MVRASFRMLLTGEPDIEVVAEASSIAAGNALLSPAITKQVIRKFTRIQRPAPPKQAAELTEREREILRLIATGLSNQEIGP